MTEIQTMLRLEKMIQTLLQEQQDLSQNGVAPHLIAGAILAFGIDRFGEVVGQRHAASILEQAAQDLRQRAPAMH
jgi:hypothetical protein